MIAKLKAETAVNDFAPGSVVLTILEAAATNDYTQSGKLLTVLNSLNVDKVSGTMLELLAASKGLTPPRIGATPSQALVTVSDTAFSKIASTIYAGANGPVAGDTQVLVIDATDFAASGTIYLGRNTPTYEPATYVSKTQMSGYWILALSSPLAKDHLVGEEVVFAQGGDRAISAGQVVQVPAAQGTPQLSYSVLNSATLADGEDTLPNVVVRCTTPGTQGRVGSNRITQFSSPPWPTAAVTNPAPAVGGTNAETDPELRQRIKDFEALLSRGTDRALIRAVIGVTDSDENERVVSASIVPSTDPEGYTRLYIDNGTGYQPSFAGVGSETVVAEALGVEQDFRLQQVPLVKCEVASIFKEPFALSGGERFRFEVDGQTEEAAIAASAYATPGQATAQEIAQAINTSFTTVEARAKDGQLFVSPVADDPEYIASIRISTVGVTDASVVVGFPTSRVLTLRLYKNDQLLSKSGLPATITTLRSSSWSGLTSSETLQLQVDSITGPTVTLTDADFVALSSSTTLANASPSDWAKVINGRFIGVTAVANADGSFSITSNRGRSSSANVQVIGGSLQNKIFGTAISATGVDPQYELNRMTGMVHLAARLAEGDSLKAGTTNTRGFDDSTASGVFVLPTINSLASQIVFVPDVVATALQVIQTGTLTFSSPGGNVQRIVSTISGAFSNLQAGDWVHLFNLPQNGLFPVYRVFTTSNPNDSVELFDPNPQTGSQALNGTSNWLNAFRTTSRPQLVTLPSGGSVTAAAIAAAINSQTQGMTATALASGAVRVQTQRYASGGALSVGSVAGSAVGSLGINQGVYYSQEPQIAAIESGDLAGSPSQRLTIQTPDTTVPYTTLTVVGTPFTGPVFANRSILTYIGAGRTSFRSPEVRDSTSQLTLRNEAPQPWVGFGGDMRAVTTRNVELGEADSMIFIADDNAAQKTFNIPMYIDGVVANSIAPSTTQFDASDSSGNAFGSSSRWLGFRMSDYRVWFRSRANIPAVANASLRITANKYGPNGQRIRFGYTYPTQPSQASSASVVVDGLNDFINAIVTLASGPAITMGTAAGQVVYVTVNGGGPPYITAYRFTDEVDPGSFLTGQYAISVTGSEFSAVNRGTMLITGLANVKDITRTFSTTGSSTTVNINSAPSFIIGAQDIIRVGAAVRRITGIVSQTQVVVDTAIDLSGGFAGTVSRVVISGVKQSGPPVLEKVTLTDANSYRVYPVGGEDASTLMDLVNNTAQTSQLVTASLAAGNTGAGIIYSSTEDTLNNGSLYVQLQNGESFVRTSGASSPTITLKEALDAAPEAGETFKFIPATPQNILDHFSKKQITGLTIAADVALVGAGRQLQVSTKTVGGSGQIFAAGGKANGSAAYSVRGIGTALSTNRGTIAVDSAVLDQASPGQLVRLSQAGRATKAWPGTIPGALDTIQLAASAGTITATLSQAFVSNYSYTHTGSVVWMVRRLSRDRVRFEIYSGTATVPASMRAGDWVLIGNGSSYAGTTPSTFFRPGNTGWFQVRQTDNSTYFDVENSSAVEENVTCSSAPFIFTKYGSARVGDQLVLGANVPVAASNRGTFTITAVPSTTSVQYSNASGSSEGPTALGTAGAADIRVLDQGYDTVREVISVTPDPTDPLNRCILTLNPGFDLSILSESLGATLRFLNRLSFPTTPVSGVNGYNYWIGLKRQAQRVVDSYMVDVENFPGYRAAGTFVEVKEPQIQVVKMSLQVQAADGVVLNTIADDLKSRILGYINNLALGDSVVISQVISLVQDAPGVASVVLVTPTAGTRVIAVPNRARAYATPADITLIPA